MTPTTVQAQLHGAGSVWRTVKEVSRTETSVRVLYQGRFHTVAPEHVRPKRGKAAYVEG